MDEFQSISNHSLFAVEALEQNKILHSPKYNCCCERFTRRVNYMKLHGIILSLFLESVVCSSNKKRCLNMIIMWAFTHWKECTLLKLYVFEPYRQWSRHCCPLLQGKAVLVIPTFVHLTLIGCLEKLLLTWHLGPCFTLRKKCIS